MSTQPPARAPEAKAKSLRAFALDERIVRLLPVIAALVVLAATVIIGAIFGDGFGVLVLAVGAMLAAITTLWNSVRALFGETPLTREDALAIGAPSAEEEQKRAVLRAIKDVEFEKSVGKITQHDYEVLVAHYRAEAKRLLRQIDTASQPERERIELMVARHLRARGIEPGWLSSAPAEPSGDAPVIEPSEASDPLVDDADEREEASP